MCPMWILCASGHERVSKYSGQGSCKPAVDLSPIGLGIKASAFRREDIYRTNH